MKVLALIAAAVVIAVGVLGFVALRGNDESSAYKQGYELAKSERTVGVASTDRCRDMAVGWYVQHMASGEVTVEDQHDFEAGCRAGNNE
jgi:hypothetical protein